MAAPRPSSYSASVNTNAAENVMIILDGSYSMKQTLPGNSPKESRMQAAKRVILQVMQTVPRTTRIGLRVYGQSQIPILECQSTKLLVPLGLNNRAEIASQLAQIQPVGQTPISLAIRVSAEHDFVGLAGKKTIILVSDGMETCDADPCQVSVQLVQNGVDVKINTVGLGISGDIEAQKQLKCVALGTNGQFYNADTSATLARGLQQSFKSETRVEAQILH